MTTPPTHSLSITTENTPTISTEPAQLVQAPAATTTTEGDVSNTIATTSKPAITINQLKEMYSILLTGYDTRIRPVLDQTKTVRVVSTFVPNNIISFDTQEQRFDIMGYFIIQWQDQSLRWNPVNFADSMKIFIPTREIWTPNVIIVKAYNGKNKVGDTTDNALILPNGVVMWVPEGIYSVVCEVDIQFYPYDVQTCSLTYYVADETLSSVNLRYVGEPSLDEFIDNAEWDILEHTSETRTHKNNTYIDLKFKLARRGEFSMFTVIAPLLMLSFLNGMIFLVPINTGEKTSFAMTIFVSYGIFITIIIDTLPHNSLNVSYFLIYIVSLLMLSVILVLYSIIQLKILATCGQKPCTRLHLVPKCIANLRRRQLLGVGVNKADTNRKKDACTWAMVLVKLDTYLFFVFFTIIAADTSLFLTAILNKVHVL